jgi:hypothetical protein
MRFLRCSLFLLALALLAFAASSCAPPPRRADAAPEGAALARAALDTLEREGCARLLTRTFPLQEPGTETSTGRLWVRRCSATRTASALDLDVDVLGWQWSGGESWGFAVREYVYFSAAIHARLSAAIETTADGVTLRVWTERPPEVNVRAIGRVDAKASTPAATLLGAASSLVGRGPNTLATAALRSRVRDLIADRAAAGIPIALGEAPAVPGALRKVLPLLDEKEGLHPGGALISGSFAPGLTTTLHWSVEGEGTALARPVCVDEALELVDAVVAERKPPPARAPRGVVTMKGKGMEVLPALACRWVLVTGPRDDHEASVALVLTDHAERTPPFATRRWVRATLVAYDLSAAAPPSASGEDPGDTIAVAFAIGPEEASQSFGRALPAARSPAVGLVAPLLEVPRDAPLALRALQQKPRPPSLFNATPGYEHTLLASGSAQLVAGQRRQQHTIALARDGRALGWAKIDLEQLEIE